MSLCAGCGSLCSNEWCTAVLGRACALAAAGLRDACRLQWRQQHTLGLHIWRLDPCRQWLRVKQWNDHNSPALCAACPCLGILLCKCRILISDAFTPCIWAHEGRLNAAAEMVRLGRKLRPHATTPTTPRHAAAIAHWDHAATAMHAACSLSGGNPYEQLNKHPRLQVLSRESCNLAPEPANGQIVRYGAWNLCSGAYAPTRGFGLLA